jgi:hypothetical protein
MFSRRGFLTSFLSAGAGQLLFPDPIDRILRHVWDTGRPLLEPTPGPIQTLLTLHDDDEGYVLHEGDPYAQPPVLTWREYLLKRGEDLSGDLPLLLDNFGLDHPHQLDDIADPDQVLEDWIVNEASNHRAFNLLYQYEPHLAPESEDDAAAIEFVDDQFMGGGSYCGVHLFDAEGVSLLQHRLNELNAGIRIEVSEGLDLPLGVDLEAEEWGE